jgi:pentatricopeptide repeat protein
MRSRGIQVNNHTYSALLNICVKTNELDLALDVFQQLLAEGLTPNIVTYNILLEVYAKQGMWQQAVQTLSMIQTQVCHGFTPEGRRITVLAGTLGSAARTAVPLMPEGRCLQLGLLSSAGLVMTGCLVCQSKRMYQHAWHRRCSAFYCFTSC